MIFSIILGDRLKKTKNSLPVRWSLPKPLRIDNKKNIKKPEKKYIETNQSKSKWKTNQTPQFPPPPQ